MLKLLNILWLLIPGIALGGTIVRPYGPSDYAGGAKAVGSKVNSEFATIASFINGKNIASDNITDLGINTANLNTGAVTKIKQTSNYAVTASSGTFAYVASSATTLKAITNLSTTITTTGKPVLVGLYPAEYNGSLGAIIWQTGGVAANSGTLWLLRDSSTTGAGYNMNGSGNTLETHSCSNFSYVDTPVSGTYVYSVRLSVVYSSGTSEADVNHCRLIVQEL